MTVECQYCGKTHKVDFDSDIDTCVRCGAPLPKIDMPPPPPPPPPVPPSSPYRPVQSKPAPAKRAGGVLALFAFAIVAFILFRVINSNSQYGAQPEPSQVIATQEKPGATQTNTTAVPPSEAITDAGLRQALELLFRKELRQIGWDEIDQIKTIAIETGAMVISRDAIPLSELDSGEGAVRVQVDAPLQDAKQLAYIKNLTVFSYRGEIAAQALENFPNIRELSVQAGGSTTDFSHFSALPKLEALYISGNSLVSLQGLSELTALNALTLNATGLKDLSVLSQQKQITGLTLVNNRELTSLNTLQDMTWLKSLSIERSENMSLDFIRNLTSLESLSVVNTDIRSYDFILPLTKLRYLRLFSNRDVLTIPPLKGFAQLEELHLDTGKNTGDERPADYLYGLSSLKRMTLHNPDMLDALRDMQSLEELDISFGFLLSDATPLGSLASLKRLRIYDSRVYYSEVANMDAIGRLSQLKELDISGNDLYFNWDFIYGLDSLEILNISHNNIAGDFDGIGNMRNLKTLLADKVTLMSSYSIYNDGGITDIYYNGESSVNDHLGALAKLTQLNVLSVSGNNITDIGFVSGLQGLVYLNLEDNYVEDVSPLAGLPLLGYVDLRKNPVTNWDALDDMVNTTVLGR